MTKSLNNSDGKGLVMKVDASGNLLWAQKLGTNTLFYNSTTEKVIERDGYVYVLTDCAYNFKKSVLISKLNLIDGSKVWSRVYVFNSNKNKGDDIALLGNQEILITGYTNFRDGNAGGDSCETFLLKLDTSGNIIKCKNFVTDFYLILGRILVNEDNQIILHGAYRDSAYSKYDLIFAALDTELNVVINYKYESSNIDLFANTIKKTDGGYLVGGSIEQNFIMKGFLIQFDSLFNVVWSRDYSGTSPFFFFYDFVVKNDKSILCAGGLANISLLDSSGNALWSKETYIPGSNSSTYTGIIMTPDNGFFAAGALGPPSSSTLIQKADSTANMGCNNYSSSLTSNPFTTIVQQVIIDTIPMTVTVYPDTNNFNITLDSTMYCYTATNIKEVLPGGVSIYPNAFQDYFEIKQIATSKKILCVLTDFYGNIKSKWQILNQEYKFDTGHLAAGFYILNLSDDQGSFSMSVKLIKL